MMRIEYVNVNGDETNFYEVECSCSEWKGTENDFV